MAEPQDWFAANAPATPPPSDSWRLHAINTQEGQPGTLDKLNEMLGPLAHPQTLTDFARLLTLPVDSVKRALAGALSMSAAGAAVKGAVNGAVKGAGAVADTVSPDVVGIVSPRAGKLLEVAKKVRDAAQAKSATGPNINGVSVDELRAAGVGDRAINATMNGRTVVPPSPAAPVEPLASGPAAPAPQAAPATPLVAPPPTAAPPPSGLTPGPGVNALPDQKALNEAALAIRRQAYQARMASAPPPVEPVAAPAAGNVKLTAVETKAFMDLLKRGMPAPTAMKNVLMQRDLAASLGTPSSAQVAADVANRNATGRWE